MLSFCRQFFCGLSVTVFLTGVRPSDASLKFSYVVLLGAQGCGVSSGSGGLIELHSFELAWLLVL